MSEKDDGGPAFPMPMTMMTSNHIANEPEYGMTLRDYFAAKALQGFLACPVQLQSGLEMYARDAYAVSDAMLKERARGLKEAGRDAVPLIQNGEVLVTVTGLTGSGKSAIAGEIEIMCRALGLDVDWVGGDAEKRLTHAAWTDALEMYRPRIRIIEANISRADAAPRWEEN